MPYLCTLKFLSMNVTLTKGKASDATIVLTMEQADYAPKVAAALQNYRKNARIPGFRPGMAPMAMVERQYGTALRVDEINKLLQDELYAFIEKEKLDLLGQPLPIPQQGLDWNAPTLEFQFEVGLAPELTLDMGEKVKLPYYTIEVSKKVIDDEVNNLRQRYGKLSSPEKAADDDLFYGEFKEVDAAGTPVEGGLSKDGRFAGTVVADKKALKALVAAAAGDVMTFQVGTTWTSDFRLENVLGCTAEELAQSTGSFAFEFKSAYRMEPAALDQELFDKVFGPGVVSSEAELRGKIQAELEAVYQRDADVHFFNTASAHLMETKMDLPIAFLKKWLQQGAEKPLSAEEVENQWPNMEKGMRWQLIEGKLVREHHLHVHKEELVEYAVGLVNERMMQFGQGLPPEEVEKVALNLLKNREQAEQMSEQVLQNKMNAFFKANFGKKEIKSSYEDFLAVATKTN